MRARVYANTADAVPVLDTGSQLACPPLPIEKTDFGRDPLADYAYADGEAVGVLWFEPTFGRKLVIDFYDAYGDGFIDIGRLWAGDYWESESNFDRGSTIRIADTSKSYRTDGGDSQTSVGVRYRKLSLSLSLMGMRDRDKVWKILQKNGTSQPMLISCYPGAADTMYEQMCTMICKLTNEANISSPFFSRFNVPLEFEEV
ncbi:hypothetical protein [Undibacterium squillarum]|nr:hypothetical protein [Undibacterium squillarum]